MIINIQHIMYISVFLRILFFNVSTQKCKNPQWIKNLSVHAWMIKSWVFHLTLVDTFSDTSLASKWKPWTQLFNSDFIEIYFLHLGMNWYEFLQAIPLNHYVLMSSLMNKGDSANYSHYNQLFQHWLCTFKLCFI